MSTDQDDLLARELAKLGASAGEFARDIADVAEVAASNGGSYGAQFAARFLPTEQYQTKRKFNGTPETILAKVYAFFAGNGRVENETAAANSPFPKISGVIGSGLLRMNPAVVHAEIVAIESGVCTLLITGAAKEGLIKQHTAEKAVQRLLEWIAAE